jgi:hypothetical protein
MIEKLAFASAIDRMHAFEGYLQLHIRPCPKYLPKRFYRWLISKLLYLSEFKEQ